MNKSGKAKLWAEYIAVMNAAENAARSFADVLETYLRKGVHSGSFRLFDHACRMADAYRGAVRRAQPYHCGTIPEWCSGHIINSSEDELINVMRELRGTMIYHRVMRPDGSYTMVARYADNGIAGLFRLEIKYMHPFGTPRRMPTNEERATVGVN